jgi:hypothetical protein
MQGHGKILLQGISPTRISPCGRLLMELLLSIAAGCLLALDTSSAQTGKHPFNADDCAALHSATAVSVAPDGAVVLWKATSGVEKGPDKEEWRVIRTDGTDPHTLDLPEHFTPYGFTKDGPRYMVPTRSISFHNSPFSR